MQEQVRQEREREVQAVGKHVEGVHGEQMIMRQAWPRRKASNEDDGLQTARNAITMRA